MPAAVHPRRNAQDSGHNASQPEPMRRRAPSPGQLLHSTAVRKMGQTAKPAKQTSHTPKRLPAPPRPLIPPAIAACGFAPHDLPTAPFGKTLPNPPPTPPPAEADSSTTTAMRNPQLPPRPPRSGARIKPHAQAWGNGQHLTTQSRRDAGLAFIHESPFAPSPKCAVPCTHETATRRLASFMKR